MSEENIEVARRFADHFDRTGEPLWDVIDSEIEVYDHDIPDAAPITASPDSRSG